MFNKLLLTGFETALVVIVGILILIFAYLLFGRVFFKIKEKIGEKQSKKFIKKITEEENKTSLEKEEKKPEKSNNKYTEILDKVHQNRQQYFTEDEISAPENAGIEKTVQEQEKNEAEFDFNSDDFEVLEKINFENDDFDFVDSRENFAVDESTIPDASNNFSAEFKRKKMIRRSQTISREIKGCSSRIKAIIALDIFNKTKF